MTKYEKYVYGDGVYHYELTLENGNKHRVKKELGDYLHSLEQQVANLQLKEKEEISFKAWIDLNGYGEEYTHLVNNGFALDISVLYRKYTQELKNTKQCDINGVMDWVAVSDRLPEIGSVTDIYTNDGHRVTHYTWESHDLQSSFTSYKITHWIAIPKPPCT